MPTSSNLQLARRFRRPVDILLVILKSANLNGITEFYDEYFPLWMTESKGLAQFGAFKLDRD